MVEIGDGVGELIGERSSMEGKGGFRRLLTVRDLIDERSMEQKLTYVHRTMTSSRHCRSIVRLLYVDF